jgi:hypothetical protein
MGDFDLVIFEEVAAMSKKLLNTILPTIVQNQGIIMISTKAEGGNKFNEIAQKVQEYNQEDDFVLFEKVMVCDKCKEEGIALQCKHKQHLIPHWNSRDRTQSLKILMDDDFYQQEALGLPSSGGWNLAFQDHRVKATMESSVDLDDISEVVLSIDPAGGKSKYTICSSTYPRDERGIEYQVILAIDYNVVFTLKNSYDFIESHVRNLYHKILNCNTSKKPRLNVIFEQGTGLEIAHLYKTFTSIKNQMCIPIRFYSEKIKVETMNDIGINIGGNNEKKHTLASLYQIFFNDGCVKLHKKFTCLYNPPATLAERYNEKTIREELKRELSGFGWKIEPKTNSRKRCTVRWSGKFNEYGYDDFVMALIENYWYHCHLSDFEDFTDFA